MKDNKAVMEVCVTLSHMAGQLRGAAGVADLGNTGRVSVSGADLSGRATDLLECVETLMSMIDED